MTKVARKAVLDIVLGAGNFGTKLTAGSDCNSNKEEIQQIIDLFKSHGYYEVDTARGYSEGTSEAILAELDYEGQGLIMDTKIPGGDGAHAAAKIHSVFAESLAALKTKKVHILYLHFPDRVTPFEETLGAINEEYKKGHFEKFGISNYTADEVEKIVQITKEKGWVQPSVYQGLYNVLARLNEDALFPVLRKHNISFFAYSPLAGSFLTGKVPRSQEVEPGSRFDKNHRLGVNYGSRFNKESFHQAIDKFNEVGKPHGLDVQEIALRWIVHHSQLSAKHGDAIIPGGRKLVNLQTSIELFEKGPLPADIVKAVEDVWVTIKADAPPYHF
eukprot:Phypoly_transcript_12425.p1 GENE.Phypoly_transcript_12425~~Phypoly_transcript_12425.p1  ORF type:complete len:330 (+),score=58.48 Phypoly_transcript_12425:132-1121(+)